MINYTEKEEKCIICGKPYKRYILEDMKRFCVKCDFNGYICDSCEKNGCINCNKDDRHIVYKENGKEKRYGRLVNIWSYIRIKYKISLK